MISWFFKKLEKHDLTLLRYFFKNQIFKIWKFEGRKFQIFKKVAQ